MSKMINEKLKLIFHFLSENRQYNKAVQKAFYQDVVLCREQPEDKIISLLHHVVNTQSQPNIDKIAVFFKNIHTKKKQLSTFQGFANIIGVKTPKNITYEDVFIALNNQQGWGKKTSALFVKSIYHLHNGEYGNKVKIWNDAPKRIRKNEKFFLPVDAVIEHIFDCLRIPHAKGFNGINKYLQEIHDGQPEKLEIWDDLWFWGFITQKSSGGERKNEWNENKYWALLHTDKNINSIKLIEKEANIFLKFLR